ncbi:hypothetical protein GGQ60_003409 [Pedobacter zeae]|uniref:Uncharacterized protein n=1 Tax=Pedobacter zeae TaxID=1737356 RepID=A0A7W6KEV4_9SPHI|nr:hypothetical protein [Pedobacter zeae]
MIEAAEEILRLFITTEFTWCYTEGHKVPEDGGTL